MLAVVRLYVEWVDQYLEYFKSVLIVLDIFQVKSQFYFIRNFLF